MINFKDICINFGENRIFDGYNLELEKGKKYVIIGESGRGKSTLMKLLMKYIPRQYYDGTVTVNGYDIQNIDSQYLYKKIGYIQKNEFLIEGTVTDNILLHRENVSCEAVSSICENLKLDKNFANKQITFSNNQQVSYGEKQRIDIARFLINDYDVLIFDEPTSNLDEKTSDVIFDTIMSIQDKIVIVITHDIRDEIIKKFDDIIKL